ncbi:MAG: ATP-binding protein [Candidatus Parabeggiatoa sp. nov. 3]|nr:MAG: ATP-binding protein [Gammaproteobacteria bacterium]RKZ54029.1 MAG: ATP-binding protein [Gammaproteobacteria bacterium]RKZ88056.1 MAG: ATP-binding protein [Gammaproteobacteria bacterium]
MLDSLYIKHFRLFKELKIEQLGRLNLIVGKNNSGKSCLLEALYIYAKNASPRILYELIEERGENWEEIMQPEKKEPAILETPFCPIFHGYQFPELGRDGIEIGSLKEIKKRLKLHIYAYRTIENEDERRLVRINEQQLSDDNPLNDADLVIEVEQGGEFKFRFSLTDSPKANRWRLPKNAETKLNVRFVPTKQLTDDTVAELWDRILLSPSLEEEVKNGLRLIDNSIQKIVVVGRRREIPMLIYDNKKQLPLKSLGDGATHLFHIILALVNARNGFLLIDEFENGLHYTIQPQVWDFVFKFATHLNVQVFATTHSWDCITAFQTASLNSQEEAILFRLGRSARKSNQGEVIATTYDKQRMQTVTQAELEVR